MTTISAQAHGYTVTLDTETSRVSISRDSGEWAGDGRWSDCSIVDCAAQLGDTQDETETIYTDLEDALGDAIDDAEAEPVWERVTLDDGCAEPGFIRECAGGWQAKRGGYQQLFDTREQALDAIRVVESPSPCSTGHSRGLPSAGAAA